jgi:hypothetical protein
MCSRPNVTPSAAASYNGVMRCIIPLFALVLCASLVAGCGGSHTKALHQVALIGIGAARLSQQADVKGAQASDHVLGIFPKTSGQRKCQIPYEGGGLRAKRVFPGVCQTSVRPGPPTIVVFSERWRPCLKGQDCMAGMRLRRHRWLLTMGPLTIRAIGQHRYRYPNPVVKSTRQRGDQPPQGPRP